MPEAAKLLAALSTPTAMKALTNLYGSQPARLERQRERYRSVVTKFSTLFPKEEDIVLFSAPGRTEVGGNHTDHNAGRVLAAAIDLDMIAAMAKNDRGTVTIHSEGYPPDTIKLADLIPVASEKYTFASLVRGVAARMSQLGYAIGGFDACITSEIPKGSGLSSSAAFEVLIARAMNHFYNQDRIEDITLAQIAQFAENQYFGKPSGLMDQTTCILGGFVTIDFKDAAKPVVKKVNYDFATSGYALVIVDTGGSHAELTEDYALVESEMKSVARAMGAKSLRQLSLGQVLESLPYLRSKVNDRAILRAIHFFEDDQRVVDEVKALEGNDFKKFLSLVVASGYSSWMLNQNCYLARNPTEQGIPVALSVSERILQGRGAYRVHGGGFAGTIQVFVPNDMLDAYVTQIRNIFGEKSCHILSTRQPGTVRVALT